MCTMAMKMSLPFSDGLRFLAAVQVLLLLSTCFGGPDIARSVFGCSKPDSVNGPVQLLETPDLVVVKNGLIEVTFLKPEGDISGISYGGVQNLLEPKDRPNDRGYLDWNWSWSAGQNETYEKFDQSEYTVISQTPDQVEISFLRPWDGKVTSMAPVNIDKRYIVRANMAAVYVYVIYDRPARLPAFAFYQTRLAYKLNEEMFHYMAISDERQRVMPTAEDRAKGQTLAFKEAVRLVHPSNPDLEGEVDDKYQYSIENENDQVHGWIAQDAGIGFWFINPSYEFRVGGPLKQELTCHVGPTALSTFITVHYSGRDSFTTFSEGEAWKKVFGPVMIYVNQYSPQGTAELWKDAKKQALTEKNSWPYNFVGSKDYATTNERGSVTGTLLVRDRYLNPLDFSAGSAYVGLALPGKVGSWQNESKGYQFWIRANQNGGFEIKNVVSGVYNLYAWVLGIAGDYMVNNEITIKPGSRQDLGNLVYEPPRHGPTLWEIGIPDRKADEFFVPQVSPEYANKLYNNLPKQWFRQYGLWDRYSELYPHGDLIYDVGTSNYSQDWFFAHVRRNQGGSAHAATTWQVNFELKEVDSKATYTLLLALAEANAADILVRFNDPKMGPTRLATGFVGWDNAIARHGIHGLYHLFMFEFPGSHLRKGKNTMFLTQSHDESLFGGVMYDYIRLEGPPTI